jgi:hypothetical protein
MRCVSEPLCVFRNDGIADDADWARTWVCSLNFAVMMRRRSKPAGRERELIGLAGAPPVALQGETRAFAGLGGR